MGKRKKSSRKPAAPRRKEPLDTSFTCLFCHHEKSVIVKIDRSMGSANLNCRICTQRYSSIANNLTEPVDVYSAWIDACDAIQDRENRVPATDRHRRREASYDE